MNAPSDLEVGAAIAALRVSYPQKAIRLQFGETILALGQADPDFVVLTADLMYATGIEAFGAQFPDRLFNLGIAEQNMAGVAAGLALCGKLPIVSGYAAFTTLRAVEQARADAAYNGVKVIFAAQSAGLSYGVGGPTHQTFEDVAIMRAIPNMTVLVPSDAAEVDACLRAALVADISGPIYIRLGRGPERCWSTPGAHFAIGKAVPLREGTDIAVFANGSMVVEALIAADFLGSFGIGVRLLNLPSVKPLDTLAVRQAALGVSAILVVEEHSVIGGLGSAVLECLAETASPPVRRIGVADIFPPIGPAHELRAHLGLCAENIVAQAFELLQMAGLRKHVFLR